MAQQITQSGTRLRHVGKLTRKGKHIRMAIVGPTGSGKTFTALMMALQMAESPDRVLFVDTEDGSAGLYAVDFEDADQVAHLEWEPPYDPRDLYQNVQAMQDDYDVIVIDSLTHFWNDEGGTMDIVDNAKDKYGGNKFAGWKEGTPAQRQLVKAVKRTSAHIIVTMQAQMAYSVDESGKPTKVGLAPIQRAGFEYQLDVIGDIDLGHSLFISKSRFNELADRRYPPGQTVQVADAILSELERAEPLADESVLKQIADEVKKLDPTRRAEVRAAAAERFGPSNRLTVSEAQKALAWFQEQAAQVPDDPSELFDADDELESLDQ